MDFPQEAKRAGAEILVVEDSATQAEQLRYLLEEEGYAVAVASNGQQALEMAREHKPALILTDVVMPKMDGYTLCRETKADKQLKDVPVVLLTSLEGAEEVLKALQCAADNFVRKPYDNQRLLSLIQYMLANRELRRSGRAELGLVIDIGGERHLITSERQQILDLLISTFMEGIQLNRELKTKQKELTRLTEELEQKVEERTATLRAEIAERKRLEDQLYQARKLEAIGRLAGGIAHDFNNHLGIVIGHGDLLLERLEADSPLHKSVEMIREAALQAASLTRKLLTFSRRQVFERKIVDLNRIVSDSQKLLRPIIGEDIKFVTSLDLKLGNVKADPTQINQVIMNLAANARDAMPEGGRLTIETANVELDRDYASRHPTVQPGRYVMLAVSDTGIGMDEKIQSHIFEPFFTTKELGKGMGLGLATIYGIIKQSGGYIEVYSEPGQGTTFKIYLPLSEQSALESEIGRAAPSTPEVGKPFSL